ncbi:hypothetical protein [Cryobacterium sp. TMT1-66-1]|uniref:hypothetical protein n=1 Tax=Cryobacterium sp. TMT1-66-1 TaxID=1259242 RepID=UPI001069ABFD|nr:hypothetical protein [Cryobacterium sp. TMT1-66-1]TFD04086.1 hypothetical protein E3T29_15620 [Cryobacterium sp. TMT1-66-1]
MAREAFKAHSIFDIWSRKIVGFRVEKRESNHLAVDMFETAWREADRKRELTLHAHHQKNPE